MAKIKKKGVSGNAKNFITRTQAVRKLQVSLADFRRLCIFKGIYPREPRNKKKANKGSTAPTTFYYTKDIQYLLHEPVLAKFREHKAFAKKLQKALGRGEYGDAKRLEENNKPKVTLDHLVKERYPTFTDAIRDLDDALSMLFLFSNLPSNRNLPAATVSNCQRLCNEWQHYVIRANVLRKSFLSIKGIYYQAEVQGQDVLWLVPYKFAQNMPADVDFRIMHTFVEFYTTLLGFVMFKLYTNEGLVYPPKFDEDADARGAGLRAFRLENKGVAALPEAAEQTKKQQRDFNKRVASLNISAIAENGEEAAPETAEEADEEQPSDNLDTFQPIKSATAVDVLPQPISNTDSSTDPANLFSQFTFFLSRETPREPLEFLLRSFGCKRIGWDAVLGDGSFTENESDPSITHQVVDRPPLNQESLPKGANGAALPFSAGGRVPGRIYVQPQYVWDCVNAGRLLPPTEYGPGALLPPHLSPWVKVAEGQYDPTAPVDEQGEESEEEEEEEEEVSDDDNGMTEDLEEEEDDDEEMNDSPFQDGPEIEDESDDEEELARKQHQEELEAEAKGVKPAAPTKKGKKKSKAEREEEEAKEMQKIMMPKKKRKLYEKMIYGNEKRAAEAENLKQKKRKLEKEKKAKASA